MLALSVLALATAATAQAPAETLLRRGPASKGGDAYVVRFEPDAVRFSPGADAGERGLRLRLASVGRRSGAVPPPRVRERVERGDAVLYRRGSVVERYELRSSGVEQSFAFAALPPGTGDLVVRLAVETDLELRRAAPDELVFGSGESYLIVFSEQFSGIDYDVYVRSVESLDCLDCEGESVVHDPPTAEGGVRIASRRSAGGTSDEALIAWVTTLDKGTFAESEARQRLYRADDGVVTNLGGGCGAGVGVEATCGRAGATDFGLRLAGAPPSTLAGVFLGVTRLDLACGSCVLVPDPVAAMLVPTDANGVSEVSFPVPDPLGAGSALLAQWLVAAPGGCGSFSFSDALEITLQ